MIRDGLVPHEPQMLMNESLPDHWQAAGVATRAVHRCAERKMARAQYSSSVFCIPGNQLSTFRSFSIEAEDHPRGPKLRTVHWRRRWERWQQRRGRGHRRRRQSFELQEPLVRIILEQESAHPKASQQGGFR